MEEGNKEVSAKAGADSEKVEKEKKELEEKEAIQK